MEGLCPSPPGSATVKMGIKATQKLNILYCIYTPDVHHVFFSVYCMWTRTRPISYVLKCSQWCISTFVILSVSLRETVTSSIM